MKNTAPPKDFGSAGQRIRAIAALQYPFVVDNVNRVQSICVSEKRGRWMIRVVMVIALIAFVGFSIFPLINDMLKNNQVRSQTTPTPTQTAQASQQSDLQAQARGYELVLQREPENQTALKGLVEVRLELIRLQAGEVKDVIDPLERLAKLNPQQTEYTVLLAQAKQYVGDVEGAAQIYRSVLTAQPGDIKALQGMVNLQIKQNRPEAAIALLQDTLKAAPEVNKAEPGSMDVPAVQLILGDVYAQQKRYEESIAIYDEIIKREPKDFRPLLAKAIVLKLQGKTDDAKFLFAKATDLAPAQFKDQIKQLASGPANPTPSVPAPALNEGAPNNPTPVPSSPAAKPSN